MAYFSYPTIRGCDGRALGATAAASQLSDYPRVRYQGTALLAPHFDPEDLIAMTNDLYSKLKLPWQTGQARAA